MPPVQPAETLAAFGICAGVVVFLIALVLLGALMLIEEVAVRTKRKVRGR
jgi:hypothetical protein